MFENLFSTDLSEEDLYSKYRFFCLKTLKIISLDLLLNIYDPEKQDSLIKRVKNYLDPIFPLIENKMVANFLFCECASELIYTIINQGLKYLLGHFKK